jgi:hypothetical protein
MQGELIPTGRQKVVAGKRNGVLEYGCIGLIPSILISVLRCHCVRGSDEQCNPIGVTPCAHKGAE